MTDIGQRVRVLLTADNTKHLGTLVRVEPLDVEEEDGQVWRLSEEHPFILLDDGREVAGFECFWTPYTSRGTLVSLSKKI